MEMYNAVIKRDSGKRYAWAAPRGHAKSTVMSLIVPLWWACEGRKKYIILIADTSHQAEAFLQTIIQEIEENTLLKQEYGVAPKLDTKGHPVAWRDREIVLTGKNGEVCIAAYGAGKGIRGAKKGEFRPDAIIVDDLENLEHVKTQEQRDKLDQWLLRTVLSLGDMETDTYIVGTVLHHDSVLSRRLNDPHWQSRIWRAFQDELALWPEKWPIEALESKRAEIGSIAFAAEYQNDPTAMGAGIFKDAWFRYYDSVPEGLPKYAGFDPAISKKETADYSALVKVALGDEVVYVLDAFEDRLSLREQEQGLIGRCQDCALVAIESTAYQVVLAEELMRNTSLPIREVHPHKDKVTRAMQLSAYIEGGKVLFDRYRHQDLMRQLLDFPMGAHDDLVDALGYAVSLAMKAASYQESSMSQSSYQPATEDLY